MLTSGTDNRYWWQAIIRKRDYMNELILVRNEIATNNNVSIELLEDFYKSIDVDEITIRTYRKGIDNFLKWYKDNAIIQLDKKTMLSYKEYLKNTYKPTTATTYLSGVRNLFKFLEELGYPNPMKNIKGIKIAREFRKQPLTREQVFKIDDNKHNNLNSLQDYRDYAIFNLLIRNGLREIELFRANKDDLIQTNGRYALKIMGKGKTDKTQITILEDGALIPLLKYLDKRGQDTYDPLFIGLASNKYGTRLTTKSISRLIKTMLKDNGYISKDLTAHSLRHTAITFALKGGASLQDAKELARHSDINTTLIYSHNIDRVENAPEQYIEKYLDRKDNE